MSCRCDHRDTGNLSHFYMWPLSAVWITFHLHAIALADLLLDDVNVQAKVVTAFHDWVWTVLMRTLAHLPMAICTALMGRAHALP